MSQAALPVRLGGLRIRSATDVAPSTFLDSYHATSELVSTILPPSLRSAPLVLVDEAVEVWSQAHIQDPSSGAGASIQILWDSTRSRATAEALLQSAHSNVKHACLLAVSNKESGV